MVLEDLVHSQDSDKLPQNPSIPQSKRYLGRFGMEGNTVKKYIGMRSEVIKTFHTELERAQVLREIFGIIIAKQDLRYIRGRVPALPLGDSSMD
jgi:hypothetical protein